MIHITNCLYNQLSLLSLVAAVISGVTAKIDGFFSLTGTKVVNVTIVSTPLMHLSSRKLITHIMQISQIGSALCDITIAGLMSFYVRGHYQFRTPITEHVSAKAPCTIW